jgi:hypothetical protein
MMNFQIWQPESVIRISLMAQVPLTRWNVRNMRLQLFK